MTKDSRTSSQQVFLCHDHYKSNRFFCSWVTFALAIWVCQVFAIGSRIDDEVLIVPEISLPYVDYFLCLLLVPFVDNSYVVYYFLQFLVKKNKQQQSRPKFVSFSFFCSVYSSKCVLQLYCFQLAPLHQGFWRLGFWKTSFGDWFSIVY